MKTLRKVSFENFERLTIVEASQLYGGTGDNPPPTPMPTDSIPTNKNDSIPSTPVVPNTPKHTVSGEVKREPNKSTTITGKYTVTTDSGFSAGGTASYNTNTGWSGGVTVSFTFGGKKK